MLLLLLIRHVLGPVDGQVTGPLDQLSFQQVKTDAVQDGFVDSRSSFPVRCDRPHAGSRNRAMTIRCPRSSGAVTG
jgi:hypothetical protein